MRHLKEKGERRRGGARLPPAPALCAANPVRVPTCAVAALLPSRRRRPSPPSSFSTPSAPPFLPLPAFLSDCWLRGASSASRFNKPGQIKGEGVSNNNRDTSLLHSIPRRHCARDPAAIQHPERGVFPLPPRVAAVTEQPHITIHRSLPSNSGARGYPRIPIRNVRIPPGFPQRIGHILAPVLPSVTALAQHQVLIPWRSGLNFTIITIFKAKWQLLKRNRGKLESPPGIGGRDEHLSRSPAVRNGLSRNLNALPETGKSQRLPSLLYPTRKR